MDSIIEKFYDPTFWFQGLFFPFVVYLIAKLFKLLPTFLRGVSRKFRKNELAKLKTLRRNPYAIQFHIAKERSYFLLFIMTGFFYLVLTITTGIATLLTTNTLAFFVTTSPLYCIELIWLIQSSLVQKLIISANKIRPKYAY
ncbi:hypothetical protein [Shewanella sp. MBTL60-007]|uniref:hypothetical protein n=1 Tax=Shewanella sp. MBTL60-007 TaxID=2815911 RepID=UPI001BC2A5FA|nr:hypothetical protein [Shewanella sp. MBTL60-007]GIU13080.1 hypothetical protein TUM3792_02340 [Shewanella sp. MBTL60-007]